MGACLLHITKRSSPAVQTYESAAYNDQDCHYDDVIISTVASQITSVSIVYSAVCSGPDQRKHQSSASLAFVRGIHRWPVNSPHKWPVTWKENVSIWWRHHDQESFHLASFHGCLSVISYIFWVEPEYAVIYCIPFRDLRNASSFQTYPFCSIRKEKDK